MQVTFWGVRGSAPGCDKDHQEIGGHTSCVSVELKDRLVVFDGGTGLIPLGHWMVHSPYRHLDLFLSHGHLDHVLGLPFFKPFWDKSFTINLYSGPLCHTDSLEDFIKNRLFCHPLFPVTFDKMQAHITFHNLKGEEEYAFEAFNMKTLTLNHPGCSLGFRLNTGGKSLCYITDMEHTLPQPSEKLISFVKKADLLIYDATYTDEEYADHQGWGHSTWQEGIKLAEASQCSRIAFYHHDLSHTDAQMKDIEIKAQKIFPGSFVARQGLKVFIYYQSRI